jgi:Protein of unknown function (DUF2806)
LYFDIVYRCDFTSREEMELMEWPGEKVLTKLIDTLEKGVGGALRPWQIRRVEGANTDARIKERLLLEQSERDIADIKAGRKRVSPEGMVISNEIPRPLLLEEPKLVEEPAVDNQSEPNKEFASAAKDSSDALALQQSVNLKKIALFAEEEAEQIDSDRDKPRPTEESAQEFDDDWFSKWRTSAQDVKREEMQRLWASLLTGEVARPGSFSLHTMNFLSRMSGTDAELLSRLAPFQTSAGIVKVGGDFFANQGLSFAELLYLGEVGLIGGVPGFLGVMYRPSVIEAGGRFVSQLTCNNSILEFDLGQQGDPPANVELEAYSITRIGREILSLAKFQSNDAYLKAIADIAIEKGAHNVKKGYIHRNGEAVIDVRVIATKSDPP